MSPTWETLPQKNFRRSPASRRCSACTRSASWPTSGEWDHVVVDCASTADAMRMLTLPATFGLYLERAWPRHRRLSSAADDARSGRDRRARWSGSTRAPSVLTGLLTDGDRVSAHLVLTAERVVAAEAARTLGSLALMGVRVDELIVNQILVQDDSYEYRNLPDHPAFDWYAERISEQQCGARRARPPPSATCSWCWCRTWPASRSGPRRSASCSTCARRRDGSPPPGPLRPVVDRESGSGFEAVYRLRLELPQIDSSALALGRVDDDLIIGAGGMRRRVRLASVLRRCIVMDAAAARQRADGAISTRSGGVAGVSGRSPRPRARTARAGAVHPRPARSRGAGRGGSGGRRPTGPASASRCGARCARWQRWSAASSTRC